MKQASCGLNSLGRKESKKNSGTLMSSKHIQATKKHRKCTEIASQQIYSTTWMINVTG